MAIGKWPHLARHRRGVTLRVPLGGDWIGRLGGFEGVDEGGGERRDGVAAFVAWLRGARAHGMAQARRRDIRRLVAGASAGIVGLPDRRCGMHTRC